MYGVTPSAYDNVRSPGVHVVWSGIGPMAYKYRIDTEWYVKTVNWLEWQFCKLEKLGEIGKISATNLVDVWSVCNCNLL